MLIACVDIILCRMRISKHAHKQGFSVSEHGNSSGGSNQANPLSQHNCPIDQHAYRYTSLKGAYFHPDLTSVHADGTYQNTSAPPHAMTVTEQRMPVFGHFAFAASPQAVIH